MQISYISMSVYTCKDTYVIEVRITHNRKAADGGVLLRENAANVLKTYLKKQKKIKDEIICS